MMARVELPLGLLQEVCGQELYKNTGSIDVFTAVCLDSRLVEEASIFFALKGEASDGHLYIENAVRSGAKAIVCDEKKIAANFEQLAQEYGSLFFACPSPLLALQALAKRYLKDFPRLKRIGITGSSGKTTTKEILAAILGLEHSVIMNEGNLNSETGLPLSVFAVRSEHEFGVFEMGMNKKGEIAGLANVLSPSLAIITNVGPAHIGILGSLMAIAEEKKEIFSCFGSEDIAILPEDDEYRDFLAQNVPGLKLYFGPKSLDEFGGAKNMGKKGMDILWAGSSVHVPLSGQHNVKNILAACTAAKALGIDASSIGRGLARIPLLFGRGEVLGRNISILQDCYNANPASVAAAISWADSLPCSGRRIYVIADMLELGEQSKAWHRDIGERLLASKAEYVVLYGREVGHTARRIEDEGDSAKTVFLSDEYEVVEDYVRQLIRAQDSLLLKGSRAMALERLTKTLLAAEEAMNKGETRCF